MADFTVQNHGSIFILTPHTPEAEAWVEEHIPDDAQLWGNGIVVEHRFIDNIVEGARADGLEVN